MVHWHDPTTIELQLLLLVKLAHLFDGVYIWEFFANVKFDWQFYSGKKEWRWTSLVYIACRWSTLATVLTNMIGFDLTSEFNCQAWLFALLFFSYASFSLSSLLLVIRAVAIWKRNKLVIAICAGLWLTNVACLIYGITVERRSAIWNPAMHSCAITGSHSQIISIIATQMCALLLTVIMMVGIVNSPNVGGLWQLLYRQGMISVLAVLLSEVPATALIIINYNDPMNLIFQTPSLVVISICATYIYRSLLEFQSSPSRVSGNIKRNPFFVARSNADRGAIRPNEEGMVITVTVQETCFYDDELSRPKSRDEAA